jgi:ABC-type cobalt transport system substrate-binding protein
MKKNIFIVIVILVVVVIVYNKSQKKGFFNIDESRSDRVDELISQGLNYEEATQIAESEKK